MEFNTHDIIALVIIAANLVFYIPSATKVIARLTIAPLTKNNFNAVYIRSIALSAFGFAILAAIMYFNWTYGVVYLVIATAIEFIPARRRQLKQMGLDLYHEMKLI